MLTFDVKALSKINMPARLASTALALTLVFGIGFGAGVTSSYAFDPSKVLDGDVSSKEVFRFYFDARKNGQPEEALSVLKYAAEKGNPAAQWKLGRMYETGDGVNRDPLAAFNIFKGIADRYSQSNPNSPNGQFAASAMVALGRYYHNGIPSGGLAADPYQARVMYTTAAMVFRNPDAQFELARMNLDPADGLHDPRLAARMLQMAHRNGHNGATALLGHMLFEGEYLRPRPVRGLVMMTEALEKAAPIYHDWIAQMQEEAFASATPDQRKKAMARLAKQK